MSLLTASEPLFEPAPLSWARSDVEQRLGFRGGRFTKVNVWLAASIAVALSVVFDLPSGPAIIAVSGGIALLSWAGRRLTQG